MKFTDLFVKRPVLAIVVNLVILIAGLQAVRSLSVRELSTGVSRTMLAKNSRRNRCKRNLP